MCRLQQRVPLSCIHSTVVLHNFLHFDSANKSGVLRLKVTHFSFQELCKVSPSQTFVKHVQAISYIPSVWQLRYSDCTASSWTTRITIAVHQTKFTFVHAFTRPSCLMFYGAARFPNLQLGYQMSEACTRFLQWILLLLIGWILAVMPTSDRDTIGWNILMHQTFGKGRTMKNVHIKNCLDNSHVKLTTVFDCMQTRSLVRENAQNRYCYHEDKNLIYGSA
jgi:hypothetical protein